MTASLVTPGLASIAMPPPWFWVVALLVWLGMCAVAAWPVVSRLGPHTRLALVLPSIAGVLAVVVASSVIRLRLEFVSALLLSFAGAAAAAAVQGIVARRLRGEAT